MNYNSDDRMRYISLLNRSVAWIIFYAQSVILNILFHSLNFERFEMPLLFRTHILNLAVCSIDWWKKSTIYWDRRCISVKSVRWRLNDIKYYHKTTSWSESARNMWFEIWVRSTALILIGILYFSTIITTINRFLKL